MYFQNFINLGCFYLYNLQDSQAGLNFASEDEANKFKRAVEAKLMERHKKRMGKNSWMTDFMRISPLVVLI